ncbi:hypothetical protein NB77_15025 [Listeria monocytogenes]|uniref:Uncharacterized protein n=3 Tax=Listeria monocytogenes TaxID=1639 RepID=A0A6W4GZG9_LISMN|nr:hypothetical protein [Listeria monocytogenes]AEO07302.1 hypothetical protein LMRG_01517 [Listeria monocytogenes 10403S]AKI44640.1 hypothetical protein L2676_02509 [Listeria monocytogenes]EAA0042303.1 hypothetical protein [Listeria monocytogenes]EAA0202931.1 hypothetical protein [Listeria monocytogenes]EAA0261048.1 hypothetical protein [Listeria monocytogenes]
MNIRYLSNKRSEEKELVFKTKIIPPEILKSLNIKMQGDRNCCYGVLEINGKQLRKGITAVKLDLKAGSLPVVQVEYHPFTISEEMRRLLWSGKY